MDINQLRQAVNSMSPDQLQNFASEAQLRYGVAWLLDRPVRKHLLSATLQLVDDRLIELGLKPRVAKLPKPRSTIHDIDRRRRPSGHNSMVRVVKVSAEEMEKLWKQ